MTNSLVCHFRTMATYNRLANSRLYEACQILSDAERKKRREAFFGSIHGTLNHIMVGDRLWLSRFVRAGLREPTHNRVRAHRRTNFRL